MSQYAININKKQDTFTIKDEDERKPNANAFSHMYADKIGEMSDGTSRPMPAEHLQNLARTLGKELRHFNIVNGSTNERLDVLEQEAVEIEDGERTVQVFTGEESKPDKDGKTIVNPRDTELRAPSEV